MKKILYYVCSVVMLLSAMLLSGTTTLAKESDTEIKKIEIVSGWMTKSYSEEGCFVDGSSMQLIAKVHLNDGKIATGEKAKVKWELCRKDGTTPQAVYEEYTTKAGYAAVTVYMPYGYSEDLQVVAYAAENESVSDTYAFKTIADKRHGTAYFQFTVGKTKGKVKVAKTKEKWNTASKSYTIVLPEMTTDGKDEFLGWQDEEGKLYSSGETIEKYHKGSYYEFIAKWKTKNGTTFVESEDEAKYKITGKDTVTLVKYTGKSATSCHVWDTVIFHNNTYKITAIGKKAFSKAAVKKVQIGKNVTKIESKAFYNCKELKTLKICSNKIKTIGFKAIEGISENAIINCPDAKKKVYTKKLKKAGLKETMTVK